MHFALDYMLKMGMNGWSVDVVNGSMKIVWRTCRWIVMVRKDSVPSV